MLTIMPALGGFSFAQVEKAAMKTTGISCGMCAAVSEVYLRQLPGIDKIRISLSQEAIMISYKPGAAFQPKQLHEALKKTDVGIVQLQIGARGRIEGQGEKRFFAAGNDRFAVVSTPNGAEIPVNTPLAIEGILNDQAQPMELKILTFKIEK